MPNRQMLINYVAGEECRIAIIENGQLEELYQERAGSESHVGNIYKGRVMNVEPAIQAAFIDFGLARNGFLHISDLHPMYFPGESKEDSERVGKKTPRRDRPPIQKCLRRGQDILVQVLKEGIGTKGPTLTSYLSIPGRFLVVMPYMEKMGVSRKVEDDDARREMRQILDELKPPEGFGFIIRTAGIGRTKTELKSDLTYLQRLWKAIERRMKTGGLGELYTESDLVIRTIRDVFTTDIESIIVDNESAAKRARDFLGIISPRAGSKVLVYKDPIPLFHRYDIEKQIEGISERTVALPSGGSLVIDSTEALVAIDVNSGKMRDNRDAETTAFKTNMEAADEICRQLRLRDLGGVIVNDLIDMHDLKRRRTVEQRFRENLKRDRARTRILAISQFGILEMTRQRMRPSLKKSIYTDCVACRASGHIKSAESVVLDVMRRLALALYRQSVMRVELTVSPDVAFQLLNRKRGQLVELEQRQGKSVLVRVNSAGSIDYVSLAAYDARGSLVDAESLMNLPEPMLESPQSDVSAAAVEDTEAPEIESPENAPQEYESDEDVAAVADSDEGQSPEKDGGEGRPVEAADGEDEGEDAKRRRRRRRRRGGRGRNRTHEPLPDDKGHPPSGDVSSEAPAALLEKAAEAPPVTHHHKTDDVTDVAEAPASETEPANGGQPPTKDAARRRRRRRGGRGRRKRGDGAPADNGGVEALDKAPVNAAADTPPSATDNPPSGSYQNRLFPPESKPDPDSHQG